MIDYKMFKITQRFFLHLGDDFTKVYGALERIAAIVLMKTMMMMMVVVIIMMLMMMMTIMMMMMMRKELQRAQPAAV